jgi:hypothetical protein
MKGGGEREKQAGRHAGLTRNKTTGITACKVAWQGARKKIQGGVGSSKALFGRGTLLGLPGKIKLSTTVLRKRSVRWLGYNQRQRQRWRDGEGQLPTARRKMAGGPPAVTLLPARSSTMLIPARAAAAAAAAQVLQPPLLLPKCYSRRCCCPSATAAAAAAQVLQPPLQLDCCRRRCSNARYCGKVTAAAAAPTARRAAPARRQRPAASAGWRPW